MKTSMATFNKFYDSPVAKAKLKPSRFLSQKSPESSPLLKSREKSKLQQHSSNLKQKFQLKPIQASKSLRHKKPLVRFDVDMAFAAKKSLFPNPFSDDHDNLSLEDGIAFEAYFGRKKHSKYLVPADTTLPQVSAVTSGHKTRSMYDLAIEHLLDQSIQSEDTLDKQINTLNSLDDRKSRPTSLIFDIETPITRNRMSSIKKPRRQESGVFGDDVSIDKMSGQDRNQAKVPSLDKLLNEERPLRRKSCTCSDCGINKKLVKNSTLVLLSDFQRGKNGMSGQDESTKSETKNKPLWLNHYSSKDPRYKGGWLMNKYKGPGSISIQKSESQKLLANVNMSNMQAMGQIPTLKKFRPFAPLMVARQNSKNIISNGITSVQEQSQTDIINEPSISPGSRLRKGFFFPKKAESDDKEKAEDSGEKPMRFMKLIDKWSLSENTHSNTDQPAVNTNLLFAGGKTPGISERNSECADSPTLAVTRKNSSKKLIQSKFSILTNQSPILHKKDPNLQVNTDYDETANESSSQPKNEKKIILLAANLAKIVGANLSTSHTPQNSPGLKMSAFSDKTKSVHPSQRNNSEPTLIATDRSQKSIDKSVCEILEKSGKHPALLAALQKLKKKSQRMHSSSPSKEAKEENQLPYLR